MIDLCNLKQITSLDLGLLFLKMGIIISVSLHCWEVVELCRVTLVRLGTVFPRHLFPVWFQGKIGQKRNSPKIWEVMWSREEGKGRRPPLQSDTVMGIQQCLVGPSWYLTSLCSMSSLSPPPQMLAVLINSRHPYTLAANSKRQLHRGNSCHGPHQEFPLHNPPSTYERAWLPDSSTISECFW